MPWTATLGSFGVALSVGLVVGLERQRASTKRDGDWFGGVRTYAIFGLLGALLATVGATVDWWVTAVGLTMVGGVLFVPALIEIQRGDRDGITSEVACTAVMMLGLLAAAPIAGLDDPQRWRIAMGAGMVIMGMLALRKPLHKLAKRVEDEDLYATVKLGLLLLVVLPLLPDVGFGPGGRINPFSTGLLVSLIAAIGFVGYLAVRILGSSRGMAVTGLLGGLVSSTAVTLNFSGRVRQQPALVPSAALGIVLASSVMAPRVLALVAVVSPKLLDRALVPIGVMALVAFGLAGAMYVRHRRDPDDNAAEIVLENPFSLGQALKFGAIYLVVLVLTGVITEVYGTGGLYLSAALSAITSVDAITLTVSELHNQGLDDTAAVTALLIACISNTLAKTGLALSLGGWKLGWRLLGIFVPMILAGVIALWAVA